MKKIIKLGMVVCISLFLVACSTSSGEFDCNENKYEKNPIATIVVEDYGTMKFELYINKAPQSVANFTELANSDFYNGLIFHRLDSDLGIIQGGDPLGNGTGGPEYSIVGEFINNNHCNDLKNEEGTIAMARSTDNDSGGSQFYLNFKNNSRIFGNDYAVFGRIIEGQDVLNKFRDVETDDSSPKKPIIIKSITVDTFDQEMPIVNKK